MSRVHRALRGRRLDALLRRPQLGSHAFALVVDLVRRGAEALREHLRQSERHFSLG